jgi:hypothetical protein
VGDLVIGSHTIKTGNGGSLREGCGVVVVAGRAGVGLFGACSAGSDEVKHLVDGPDVTILAAIGPHAMMSCCSESGTSSPPSNLRVLLIDETAEKTSQDPHGPWLLTGATTLVVLQSTEGGIRCALATVARTVSATRES